jgi:cytochrome b
MTNKFLVWDLPVRSFHWLLVLSLISSWYTSDGERGLIEYHLKIGYFTLGLVLFRIIWGILGTQYAKFSQFFPTKQALKSYLSNFKNDNSYNTVGHNPLGGLMVLFMLTLVLLQAISGLFMNDDVFTTGPYFESVGSSTQKLMSFIHNNVFDVIIVVSLIHISAVLYYLLAKKINLIVPMITGYKLLKTGSKKGIDSSKLLLAFVVILVVAVFLYWLVVLNVPVEEEFYY